MKITQFDDRYSVKLGQGNTTLVSGSSGGSNSGLGGDVSGSLGNVSVNGLRRSVSLGSNLGTGVLVGDVLTIMSTAGTPIARFATPSNTGGGSFGSNATRVSASSFVGASTNGSREDHRHDGIGTITASSSNTMDRGTFNLRAGSNVSFGLTDSDGSGGFDTLTVNASATGGAGGGTLASAAYKRSTGDYTSSSSTFVDLDSTNMSLTITTGAHRVLIGFTGTAEHTGGTSDNVIMDFTVDGTRQGGTLGLMSARPGSNIIRVNCSFTFLTDVLSAASHTFKVQWRRLSTGTMTMHADSTDTEAQFYVMEQGG